MVGLILTIGSLIFVLLLMVVYFSKQRFLSMKNKIYRYLLISTVLISVTQIISTLLAIYFKDDFITLFVHRLTWLSGFIWFVLIYYYAYCFITGKTSKNIVSFIKENSRVKFFTYIFVIALIVFYLVPFLKIDETNIIYLPKYVSYYVYAFGGLIVILTLLELIIEFKNTTSRKKLSVAIMLLELAIIFIFQVLYPTISMSAIGTAIQVYFLYFSIENPDLKIISELENVKTDINKSNRAKTDFLSNMSHEIRTPMNAIVGFSEALLNSDNFSEERARIDIQHISNAGNNLLDIINNILDISKIESGKDELENKVFSISNVIMELSSIIEARLGDGKVKLILDVDENIPSKYYGDQTKLFQVLLNVLTNAVKYTEVGKIKLSVSSGLLKNGSIDLNFKISDTGYGIKKEDYNKLFEKFNRLDSAIKNEIEGTGLGLVITKRYVNLMGGNIRFDSEYGVGTTFYIDIPFKVVDSKEVGQITDPTNIIKEVEYIDCSKYRIMIVDDNKLNIKVASRILQKYNFIIDSAFSGQECINKFKQGQKYDMIFMDHMMPEMDGIETMHIIKKLDGFYIPPVVALTANAITGMKEMYLREGFDEYISKPINLAELNKIIKKYFEKGE